MWLCSNKALFAKMGSLDPAIELWLAASGLCYAITELQI